MSGRAAFSGLSVERSMSPMEARLVDHIPEGEGWQYEPKWDGFRCLAFRDGDHVELMSKSGKALGRYFPELLEELKGLDEQRFVVDGEIILPIGGELSFAALQARLHPAASRIARLSHETPAQLILFDCLQAGAQNLVNEALDLRRKTLDSTFRKRPTSILLSPFAHEAKAARKWLEQTGGALDGVMAKRRDEPYRPGERAMFKHKVQRTADCVVGGLRYDQSGKAVASLLLGLYDEAGLLHHVGFTSSFSGERRAELAARFEPLKAASAFTGSAPGGASRWAKPGASSEWIALAPSTVVEVTYDQVTGDRFRHGTTFRRWRPDKSPAQCTFEQLAAGLRPEQLDAIIQADRG